MASNFIIKAIKAHEILDSKGEPTVEVELETGKGIFSAATPSGVSTGKDEALELRDGGSRHQGRGVLKAVANVQEVIAPKLKGQDAREQEKIDEMMIELDGTANKSRLGANAILPVSMAVARAGAKAKNLPLYHHLSQQSENRSRTVGLLPTPCVLLLEGGLHRGSLPKAGSRGGVKQRDKEGAKPAPGLAIQEFMVLPQGNSFAEKFERSTKIYETLGSLLKAKYGEQGIGLGREGGFVPPLAKAQEALAFIVKAIEQAGLQDKVKVALDIAATHFYREGSYEFEGRNLGREELLAFYAELLEKYPIASLEDPFAEEDWPGFKAITKSFGSQVMIIGDDLLVTNLSRIKKAVTEKACNTLLLKPNQIGTVTEAIRAGLFAKKQGWPVMVSHRAGETRDDFIADLAVALGAEFLKAGAPSKPERMAKYNRLLEIEREVKSL